MVRMRPVLLLLLAAGLASCLAAVIHAQSSQKGPWTPIAWVAADAAKRVHVGGEGGQWPRSIAIDSTGQFLLWGTDVGGLYRSLNGGADWEPCNVGYTPRGTACVAIDPHNSERCLSVGANSTAEVFHGIWLSTDKAASWRLVRGENLSCSQDMREQLAYDPSTYDANHRFTKRVYWSRAVDDSASWGTPDENPAMYRSSDGGQTWEELPGTAMVGGSIVRVHPTKGVVYAGNATGLYRSTNGGTAWTRTYDAPVTGVDVDPHHPDRVVISAPDGIYNSTDAGRTFVYMDGSPSIATDGPLRMVKVSPADPDRMVVWREGANWNWPRFSTSDGGKTWKQAKIDSTGAFLPCNARQGIFAWDPRQAEVCFSTGGDWPTRSTDGGRTWKWCGDGVNNVLVGGFFAFNQQNSNLLFAGSQDYNGAVTADGGATWKLMNPSGNGWGGYTYGAYAASAQVLYVGNAAGWGDPRYLTVSHDGGRTWKGTGLAFEGPDVSYGHPTNPSILFASNLRSTDGGDTWKPMRGCGGVYASRVQEPKAGGTPAVTLYGQNDGSVVESVDGGATWRELAWANDVRDMAVDQKTGRLYVAAGGTLQVLDPGTSDLVDLPTPEDSLGGIQVRTVAVDPVDPRVVYVGTWMGGRSASNAVSRSLDSGKTWQVLTRQKPLAGDGKDGGREACCIRVNPATREAWVATSCYGMWKVAPPCREQRTGISTAGSPAFGTRP